MHTMENTLAEWMSKQCGLQRIERLVESFAATWAGNNKGQSVRTGGCRCGAFHTVRVHGSGGYVRESGADGNSPAMLQLPHLSRVKRCEAFIPREDVPTIVSTVEPIVKTAKTKMSRSR